MARVLLLAGIVFVWWTYGTPHVRTSWSCQTNRDGTCGFYDRCTYWGLGGYRTTMQAECPGIGFY